VGGGTPFFTARDNQVNLNLLETRTFPDGVLLTWYGTRRGIPDLGSARARATQGISWPLGDPHLTHADPDLIMLRPMVDFSHEKGLRCDEPR
jgi:hypothetical protein